MDRKTILAYFGGDEELLDEAVALFKKTAPKQLLVLEECLQSIDVETFHRTAHSLKSASAMIGAEHLASVFAKLEALGIQNNLSPCPPLLLQAKDMLRECLQRNYF